MENFQIAFNNAVKKIKTKIINRHFETLNNIYISKNAVLNNFDLIQKLNPDCSIFPVLKSYAYGHGIKEMAKILNERNIDYIVVDSYYEFLQIQKVNKNPVLLI
jgi:alanine racemase